VRTVVGEPTDAGPDLRTQKWRLPGIEGDLSFLTGFAPW
jgi:hypothetical protein